MVQAYRTYKLSKILTLHDSPSCLRLNCRSVLSEAKSNSSVQPQAVMYFTKVSG